MREIVSPLAGFGSPFPRRAGGLSLALTDLSDVTITAPVNGQALVYNGTEWVNQ